jgi:hypothetical protein
VVTGIGGGIYSSGSRATESEVFVVTRIGTGIYSGGGGEIQEVKYLW